MPILQSEDYWKESGRWYKMGDELVRVTDRKGAGYALVQQPKKLFVKQLIIW